MITYSTTTFHFPIKRCEIDWNGKNTFKLWSIDNFDLRDHSPLWTVKNFKIKTYNQAKQFAINWLKQLETK